MPVPRLLIASSNAGKVREFRDMLHGHFARDILDLKGLSTELAAVEETGHTFRANACLKAAGYAHQAGMWALADDSGLEVDALEGKPGVFSARWAELHGQGKGDADNNAFLLRQLDGVPDSARMGRFICVLALADPDGRVVLTAADSVEGRILHQPRGENGFGYDPLFFNEETRKTTAELPPEEKHRISHRGKAIRRLRELMERAGLM